MDISAAIAQLVDRRSLSQQQSHAVIGTVMRGEATPAQIAGLLVALRMKGETVDELTGAVAAMRELSVKVTVSAPNLVDTCGTGGSGMKVFNVSTASAFVTAAAGAHVAKHGNRGASSKFGSADVLEAAGIKLDLTPAQITRCVEEVGVGFMFAPAHHAAMRHVGGPRRELGIRTLFNLLGPMTNPAGAPAQVIGVFDRTWMRPMAETLQRLGSRHVLLVNSDEGLDELSIAGPNAVVELHDGDLREYSLAPEDVGLTRHDLATLQAHTVEESLARVQQALTGDGAASDMVALNAAAAIYASGLCGDLRHGVHMAQDAMSSGLAQERFDELARVTRLMSDLNQGQS